MTETEGFLIFAEIFLLVRFSTSLISLLVAMAFANFFISALCPIRLLLGLNSACH
jgi:hypothetical protein